jgi:hypothetical protein
MAQFVPLGKLTGLVASTRGDLARVRSISATVGAKAAALTNRKELMGGLNAPTPQRIPAAALGAGGETMPMGV